MKGFIRKSAALLCLAAGVPIVGGCYCYRELVDPCWPERYNSVARHEINDVFDAQALNGHVYDQTLWNFHFTTCWLEVPDPSICNCAKPPDVPACDPKNNPDCKNEKKIRCIPMVTPTAELNYAGKKRLEYVVQRIPGPDGKVFLQTAFDLPIGTPVNQIVARRNEMNVARARAVREYLDVLMAGRVGHPVNFEIVLHDRPTPDQPALPHVGAMRPTPVGAIVDNWNQFLGSIPISPIFGGMMGGSSGGAP